jgi:hypothetical protein
MSNYLKLELGQSQTVALRYPTPKEVNGFDGPQLRWQLMDGRALYTPLEVKPQIDALKLKPGQSFSIIRARQNGSVVWKVQRLEQPAAALLNGSGSLDSPVPREDGERIPPTRLEHALKTAVHAAAAAEKHGRQIGYPIRFQSQDVRAMAISLYIGMERDAA